MFTYGKVYVSTLVPDLFRSEHLRSGLRYIVEYSEDLQTKNKGALSSGLLF